MLVTRAPLDTAARAALRAILATKPGVRPVEYPSFVPEQSGPADPPVLSLPEPLERAPLAPVRVAEPVAAFDAFLDGTQEARVVAWDTAVPYVFGTAGAVIRFRRDRRLQTWSEAGPLLHAALYVPAAYSSISSARSDLRLVDTTSDALGPRPSRHPAALLERALTCLQRDREALERRLAESWVSARAGILCADGPLPALGSARTADTVVGVVKSHRTIYADGPSLDLVMSLSAGERTPAFQVRAGGREPVMSWYLRTRDTAARGALWGLVRIETAMTTDVSARADTVSRWVLAENAPVALPDHRWDRMTYGVQNCESFLKAVT